MKLFSELCRRNVFKFAAVYAATGWLLWQIIELVVENFNAPTWVMPVFILILSIGFPIALTAAWLLELTPNGIRLVKHVDPADSISSKTGRQLMRGFIMILSMAVVLYLTDRFRDEMWFGSGDTEIEQHDPGVKEGCTPTDPSYPECNEKPNKDKE